MTQSTVQLLVYVTNQFKPVYDFLNLNNPVGPITL